MEGEGTILSVEEAHAEGQRLHSSLTHEDFLRMKDEGCPVCRAQRKIDTVIQGRVDEAR